VLLELDANNSAASDWLGGKVEGLRVAIGQGFRVPPSVIVPPSAVPPHDEPSDDWLGQVADQIVVWATEHEVRHLCIRSSVAGEDGAQRSHAGIFESRFASVDRLRIADSLRLVLASRTSSRAIRYMSADASQPRVSMAILVQATVPARSSGVAFLSREGARSDLRLTLEATWGLSLDLVQGVSRGDRFDARVGEEIDNGAEIVPKSLAVYAAGELDLAVPGDWVMLPNEEKDGGPEGKVLWVDEEQSLIYVRLPEDLAIQNCISEATLGALINLSNAATSYRLGIDVEFVEDFLGRIWIVQVRPITSELPPRARPSHTAVHQQLLVAEPGAPGVISGRLVDMRREPSQAATPVACDSGSPHPEILLCGSATPDLLDRIFQAGGLVSSDAGVLSHTAILCRELGKPCVLGANQLPEWAVDGALVRIDGGEGIAVLLAGLKNEATVEGAPARLATAQALLWPPTGQRAAAIAESGAPVVILLNDWWGTDGDWPSGRATQWLSSLQSVMLLVPLGGISLQLSESTAEAGFEWREMWEMNIATRGMTLQDMAAVLSLLSL
jgi:phosphoenolpyruvate synthase/pyruvate phosphate dikinase